MAIKRFDSGRADSEAMMRFVQEQHLRLEHPHLVSTRGWVQDAHRSLLVMDYVHGPDLQQVVDADFRIPGPVLVEWARQLLLGLGHVHELGIIHRDIKPSNVLVDVEAAAPVLKLADFGSALLLDGPRLTSIGGRVGTYPFVAPEVLATGEADEASDLYAVGITLQQLRDRCDDHVPSLDELVTRLVRQDPRERPRSAAVALLALADVDPASDVRFDAQLRRLAGQRPRPPVIGVGGVVGIALAVAVGGVFVDRQLDQWAFEDLVDRPLGIQLDSSAVSGGVAVLRLGNDAEVRTLGDASLFQCEMRLQWSGPDNCDPTTEQAFSGKSVSRVPVRSTIRTATGSVDCRSRSCALVLVSDGRSDLVWTQLAGDI